MVGGLTIGDVATSVVQEFDPVTRTWSLLPESFWLSEAMWGMTYATVGPSLFMSVGKGVVSNYHPLTLLKFSFDNGWEDLGQAMPPATPGAFCLLASNDLANILPSSGFTWVDIPPELKGL